MLSLAWFDLTNAMLTAKTCYANFIPLCSLLVLLFDNKMLPEFFYACFTCKILEAEKKRRDSIIGVVLFDLKRRTNYPN